MIGVAAARGRIVRRATQWPGAVVIAACVLLLCASGVRIAATGPGVASHLDFGSGYTAATIIRAGSSHSVYDLNVQSAVGDRIFAPDHISLEYEEVALGAVVLEPLTLLPLDVAYIVWAVVQFLLVCAAVIIAVRAAPRPAASPRPALVAISGIAAVSVGVDALVGVGQWTGVNALGVALAYSCWRRGSYVSGGVWLVATAALFKPHLALGLAAFLIGWANRRAILGAAAAAIVSLAALIALVGAAGVGGFVTDAVRLTAVWSERGGASFLALPSMWLGDGRAAYAVGLAGTVAALAACFALGRKARRDASLLGPALATATALSLLASPHAYLYDNAMLAPAVAWSLAELGLFSVAQPRRLASAWTIVVLWGVAPWLAYALVGPLTPLVLRVGELQVWLTLALAAALWSIPAETRALRQRQDVMPGLPALL